MKAGGILKIIGLSLVLSLGLWLAGGGLAVATGQGKTSLAVELSLISAALIGGGLAGWLASPRWLLPGVAVLLTQAGLVLTLLIIFLPELLTLSAIIKLAAPSLAALPAALAAASARAVPRRE